jgi:hypothetical protein
MGREDAPLPTTPVELQPVFAELRKNGRSAIADGNLSPAIARAQARRLLFFFGQFSEQKQADEFTAAYLNSRMLPVFARWQQGGGRISDIELARYQRNVMHVLQEHFAGLHLPEDASGYDESIYVTLSRKNRDIRQTAQVVLARFNRNDFVLELRKVGGVLGANRYSPVLRDIRYGAELELELPFLDYVTQRHNGDLGGLIQANYIDRLERFKAQLLRCAGVQDGMMLVRLQTNYRFATQRFSIRSSRLEVI